MIRPFTFICLVLAAASGLYLYQSKHRAQMLDREIQHTIHETETARARIEVLRAEWALLNEPDRLSDLAGRFLGLKPLSPGQFAALGVLAARLPAPEEIRPADAQATDEAAEPAAPGPEASGTDTAAASPAGSIAMPVPEKPKPENAAVAMKPPAAGSPPRLATTGGAPEHATAAAGLARRPRPAATLLAGAASPLRPAAAPAGQNVTASTIAHLVRVNTAEAGVPVVTSALGSAHASLPPPVPVSAADGALPASWQGRR